MVNAFKPDERSVMTYVSAYYHAFAGAHKVKWLKNAKKKVKCVCVAAWQILFVCLFEHFPVDWS